MQRDRRSGSEILAAPRWQPLRHRADCLDLQQLRNVDRLLKLCEAEGVAHIDDVTEELITKVDEANVFCAFQRNLARALHLLVPGTLLASRAANSAYKKQRAHDSVRRSGGPKKVRLATKSVPEHELPVAWQKALADMRLGIGSLRDRAPAPTITETIAMKLRQLAKSASDRNLPVELSLEAIAALHADMNSRGVKSATKRATASALERFARYTGAPQEIQAELARVTTSHDKKAKAETKRKEVVLASVDVSASTVLAKAKELLASASSFTNPRDALARKKEAFCLAFFMLLPLRLTDTGLVFGRNLIWDGTGWEIVVRTSKTGEDQSCRVDPYLTPYIDALVLNGLDPAYLDAAREDCLSMQRDVLIKRSGQPMHYGYVSTVWWKYFGTGEHIARTEVHEAFALARGAAGTELALAACGQRSAQTANHYHTKRIHTARLMGMQAGVLELAEQLPAAMFEV